LFAGPPEKFQNTTNKVIFIMDWRASPNLLPGISERGQLSSPGISQILFGQTIRLILL